MSAGHSNRSICTTNECWFQLSLINVWLECCYAARLIISDCTLSCLCLMVEEQITEGSLSGSWWPAPVTDWDQWSWQRRASGGTLHNRQQEPPHWAHRATPSHRRHYRVTQSPHSPQFSMFNCFVTGLELKWLNFVYLRPSLHIPYRKSSFSSDGKNFFCSSFTYLWFYSDTVLGCSRRVMSGFLRQPFFKIISQQWE